MENAVKTEHIFDEQKLRASVGYFMTHDLKYIEGWDSKVTSVEITNIDRSKEEENNIVTATLDCHVSFKKKQVLLTTDTVPILGKEEQLKKELLTAKISPLLNPLKETTVRIVFIWMADYENKKERFVIKSFERN